MLAVCTCGMSEGWRRRMSMVEYGGRKMGDSGTRGGG